MHPNERRKQLLGLLETRRRLALEEVQEAFAVSPATARRDIADLHRRGLVARDRGGIARLDVRAGRETPLGIRAAQFEREKSAVMREAARLLAPDDAVFVDVGSTLLHWLGHVPAFPLRVITNFLPLATALAERQAELPQLELTLLGGTVYPQSFYTYGPATLRQVAAFHARWAFISPDSLAEDGYGEVNEFVAENQKAMIRHSDRVALVVTHHKLNRRSPVRVAALDPRFVVITDAWPANEPLLRALEKRGVTVIRARTTQS